jgi:hypothetical protein
MNDPRIVIDISKWQDHIKPDELEGVEAVILKSGSGMNRDPKFEKHGTVLANAGIPLMAYHWDDIIVDPAGQAEWALEDIVNVGLPIKFLWADQEQSWTDWDEFHDAALSRIPWSSVKRASSKNISLHNSIFMKTLSAKAPKGLCGVYTNRGFTSSWANETKSWIGDYQLWVAHYGNHPKKRTEMTWTELKQKWLPDYKPALPEGADAQKLLGHQFTGDRCMLPGVYRNASEHSPLDVNVFDGAFIDQIKTSNVLVKAKKTEENQPPAWPDSLLNTDKGSIFIVNVDVLNIRKGPGTNFSVQGFLTKNQQVTVTERQGKWAKLESGGWVYASYLTPVGN